MINVDRERGGVKLTGTRIEIYADLTGILEAIIATEISEVLAITMIKHCFNLALENYKEGTMTTIDGDAFNKAINGSEENEQSNKDIS